LRLQRVGGSTVVGRILRTSKKRPFNRDAKPVGAAARMSERIFGEIPGMSVGRSFANREELSRSGVHRPLQAGISGAQDEGADSIVLSGGYEDDQDFGDLIVYTGHGGPGPSQIHARYIRIELALTHVLCVGCLIIDQRRVRPPRSAASRIGFAHSGVRCSALRSSGSGQITCPFSISSTNNGSGTVPFADASELLS
jgi:hypothetical protein